MKVVLTCIFLLQLLLVCGQEKKMKLINSETNRELSLFEGQRVRVKTVEGEKFSGKLSFIDNETILVRNEPIRLENIEKIKKNPLALTIINSVFYGTIAVNSLILSGIVVILAVFVDVSVLYALIPLGVAAAASYAMVVSPNFLYGYKSYNGWSYSVVEEQ